MLKPPSRRELVRRLKTRGFEGPYPSGKHQWVRRGSVRIIVPDPHGSDIDPSLTRRILRQGGISEDEWNQLE